MNNKYVVSQTLTRSHIQTRKDGLMNLWKKSRNAIIVIILHVQCWTGRIAQNDSLWSETTLITGGLGGARVDLPSWKKNFILGPWLFICKFIEIFNQMELIGEKKKTLKYDIVQIFRSKFETSHI